MNIKIKYSKEEVEKFVLEHHEKRFGNAPEGESWSCSGDYYDGWKVENIKNSEEPDAIPDKESA